jgi:hypothetical protein
MKAKCLALILLGLSASLGAGEPGRDAPKWQEPETIWGEPNDGLRMGVAVAKHAFAWGEPIVVGVRIQNLSEKRRHLPSSGEGSWNMSVTVGPKKEPARSIFDTAVPTGYAQPWRNDLRRGGLFLEAGATWYEVAPVTRYFVMLPATYIITISYPDQTKPGGAALVQAPPVEVEVRYGLSPDPAAVQMLQLDWQGDGGIRGDAAVGDLVWTSRDSLQLLCAFAKAHPETMPGRRARRALVELRTQLDELLKEVPPPPNPAEKAKKAEPKPQADAAAKQAEPEKAEPKAAAP